MHTSTSRSGLSREVSPEVRRIAFRTAFVARFIVLREGRRSRAHRLIEELTWGESATADDLLELFRNAFLENGDKMQPVERDLKRAYSHAQRSADYFPEQYMGRASTNFRDSLADYNKSNQLLFGESSDEIPRSGGWRIVQDIPPSVRSEGLSQAAHK